MVRITDISFVRNAACILLDSGDKYWVRKEDLPSGGFSEGVEYAEDQFIRQISLLQYPRALNLAVAMLARRPCSSGEIASRLVQRRFSQHVADLVVYKLEKEKLLNDEDFCDQWIRSRMDRKVGPAMIRMELKMKGLSEEQIEAAFERADLSAEQQNAVSLALKAWKRIGPDEDIRSGRRKVIASLVRKGYSWDQAQSACDTAEKGRI